MGATDALLRKRVRWCYGVLQTKTDVNDEDLSLCVSVFLLPGGCRRCGF